MFAGLAGMQALFFLCAGYWLGRRGVSYSNPLK